MGYRDPDLLRVEIRIANQRVDSALGNRRAKVDVGRRYGTGMNSAKSDRDKIR
jgi:hypothetical protein